MMKIIKKSLIGLISLVLSITIFSCNEKPPVGKEPIAPRIILDKPDEYYENEVKKMYDVIYPIYENITKTAIFAPKEWVSEEEKRVKDEYRQKGSDTFNTGFFRNYPNHNYHEYIEGSIIKVKTKDEFDTHIINKFKELNNNSEYNENSKIKKLFEELYLNNQDVYTLLEDHDIFIKYRSSKQSPNGGFIIPIYENNEVTINWIGSYESIDPRLLQPPAAYIPSPDYVWEVFLVKKGFTPKYNGINRDIDESAQNYRDRFVKWYNNVFAKYYL